VPAGPDYHLSEDLVDRAIQYLRDQKVNALEKPFFLSTRGSTSRVRVRSSGA
jgi:hypothetical protein